MKQESNPSHKPSASQSSSMPDRQQPRQVGQANREQAVKSENTQGLHTVDPKQQGTSASGNPRQQLGDTAASKNSQTSPSRDRGHSPTDSKKSGVIEVRADNSTRPSGKTH